VWLQRSLIGLAAALLAWAALLLADQYFAQRLAREAMQDVSPPPAIGAGAATDRPLTLVRGAPIGELSIPRLHLSAIVLHAQAGPGPHRADVAAGPTGQRRHRRPSRHVLPCPARGPDWR
jgi:hypothetical protein